MIDRKMIYTWTGGRIPTYELISSKKNERRILQLYEFDKEVNNKEDYLENIIEKDHEILFKDTSLYKKQQNLIKELEKKQQSE